MANPLTTRPLHELAEELGVEVLLIGSIEQVGSQIHGEVSLVDAKEGLQYWSHEFEGLAHDIQSVQQEIALSVAAELKGRLSAEDETVLRERETQNDQAYTLYQRGQLDLQKGTAESISQALTYFDSAVTLDTEFAEAHVGKGAALTDRYFYGWSGGLDSLIQAEDSFRKALSIKPDLVAGLRGLIRIEWENLDGVQVRRLGARLEQMDQDDSEVLLGIGEAFMFGGLPGKAISPLERSIALNPAGEGARWFLVVSNAWAGNYQEAIDQGQAFFERFREDPEIHTWVGFSYHLLGDLESSAMHYRRAVRLFRTNTNFYVLVMAGLAFQQLGNDDEAEEVWRRGVTLAEQKLDPYPDNIRIRTILATLYGLLGDRNRMWAEGDQALATVPGLSSMFITYLGMEHLAQGEEQRALELWRTGSVKGMGYPFWRALRVAWGLEDYTGSAAFQAFDREAAEDYRQLLASYE